MYRAHRRCIGPLSQGSKEGLPGLIGQEGNTLDLFATAGYKLHSQGISFNIRDETTISVERTHITDAQTQQLGKLQATANESKQDDTLDSLLVNCGQDGGRGHATQRSPWYSYTI